MIPTYQKPPSPASWQPPPLLRSSRGSREAHYAKGIEEILPLSANEAILTEMSEERPDETSGTRGDRGISCTAVAMSGL